MNNKRTNGIILEVAIWVGLYLLWIFIFQNRTITFTRTMGIEFCYLVFIALNYYFIAYFNIPKLLNRQQYVSFFLVAFLSTATAAVMRAGVAYYISSALTHNRVDFQKLCINSMLNISIWTIGLLGIKLLIDKRKEQRYTEAVVKEKIINELNFLKAQHNPHFLFNSLNALYFQIDKNNNDARGTLLKLSEMLRYQLYECNADTISIEKEISYLNNYIELQKIRLNENYKIELSIEQTVRGFTIAPLLIIPLVENAFKHISHYTDRTNSVQVRLSIGKTVFTCYVANTTEENTDKETNPDSGIGLKNLERRLELLYPGKHTLVYSNNSNLYEITLSITL